MTGLIASVALWCVLGDAPLMEGASGNGVSSHPDERHSPRATQTKTIRHGMTREQAEAVLGVTHKGIPLVGPLTILIHTYRCRLFPNNQVTVRYHKGRVNMFWIHPEGEEAIRGMYPIR